MCASGGACSSFEAGHAVHLIQARLVASTPAEWSDAIVIGAAADGTITLARLHDDAIITVWNGAGAADLVREGEPVALHDRYHALSVGGRLFNTLVLSAPAAASPAG